MSGKIVYLLCILFCVGACSDDRFSDSGSAVSPPLGEAIPVSLSLDVAPLLSPLSGTTRTDADGSGLQASFSGMEVELSGKSAVDTRTLPEVDESRLGSVVILQFDGVTPQSKPIKIQHIAAVNQTINLDGVTFNKGESSVSRIVIIANLVSEYFDDWKGNLNSKSYADLLDLFLQKEKGKSDKYPLYETTKEPKVRALMFGQIDIKIEAGKRITVVLQRIFAKASFDIKINEKLTAKYTKWQAQLLNLPSRCYFVPIGRENPFPSADDGYYSTPVVQATNGRFDQDEMSFYLPVHLQPEVQTATEKTRTLVAPTGSSYLQIIGMTLSGAGVVTDQVIYQIYLGSNFTTNYTISPNTFYKYTIRVENDDPQDGTIIKFIPGYWGGELKGYTASNAEVPIGDENAVKWRYQKQIEVYPFDLPNPNKTGYTMPWGPANCDVKGALSLTDGRENTWKLHGADPQSGYAASYACYRLNDRSVPSKEKLKWYLPGIAQLVGTYIVASNLVSTLNDFYWSSTAKNKGAAYYMGKDGRFYHATTQWEDAWVRAVRDVEPVN